MRRTIGIALLLSSAAVAAGHAQIPRRVEMARPDRAALEAGLLAIRGGFASVESVLRQRERLALTEAQVAQLEAIRKEEVTRRQNASHDAIDLESRIAAGLVTREETRGQMETRSEALRTHTEQLRERIDTILTDEQKQKLRELRVEPTRATPPRRGGVGFAPSMPGELRARIAPGMPGELRARIAPGMRGELRERIAPMLPGTDLRVFPGARVRPGLLPRVQVFPRDTTEPLRYRRRGIF